MALGRFFVARAAIAEIVPLDDAAFLEQAHRAVDRGDGDMRIDGVGATIEFLDIGMVGRLAEYTRDDPTLIGHPHVLFDAEFFDPIQVTHP